MRFLNIDQHISVSADLRGIFNSLGHTITEVSLSGHAKVIGRPLYSIPMLDGENWCGTITEKKFKEFNETYKKLFDNFDGFICCYPPIFSLLYQYTNKPIIIDIPIRYEYGAEYNPKLWNEFNSYLRESENIHLVANSIYDQKYSSGFIGRNVDYISSWCGNYTGMSYNPVKNQTLLYAAFDINDSCNRTIKKERALKCGYAWQEVANYKSIVHFPYQVSTMSIFEQYAANIPLFFPTQRFLLELFTNDVQVLHQISFNQIAKRESKSCIEHNFKYDPNNYKDLECIKHWLKYADYYSDNMRCVNFFDSFEELEGYLNLSDKDLKLISNKMRMHNIERKYTIHKDWDNVLRSIS